MPPLRDVENFGETRICSVGLREYGGTSRTSSALTLRFCSSRSVVQNQVSAVENLQKRDNIPFSWLPPLRCVKNFGETRMCSARLFARRREAGCLPYEKALNFGETRICSVGLRVPLRGCGKELNFRIFYGMIGRERGMKEMKKFEGMLFCTDLDGTLYADDKTVSRENLDAIEYFKSRGGLFTFITGRPPATAGHICSLIHPNAPYGCFNGGGIYDPQKEEYLWTVELPADVSQLVAAVDRCLPDVGIQYNTRKGVYFNKDNPAMERFRKLTGLPNVGCHFTQMQENAVKIVFAHLQEERIAALMDLLHSHPRAGEFDFIRSEKILYEILPKGVSKGAALEKMAQLLGIEMKNTVAAGDYNNDVSMIRAAGLGFAVANAVPEAKEAADSVTVSNNHNAIASIIDFLDCKIR